MTKVPLPVLVLDHTSNLCRRDHDTCEYGAFFFNSLGAKFSVFSLETTVISMEDQIYAILFKVHYFLSYFFFMVGPLCFATPVYSYDRRHQYQQYESVEIRG